MMRPVYRGVVMSLLLAIVTVASLLWQIRRADLRILATKADIAAINTERKREISYQEKMRATRYNSLAEKIDSVKQEVKRLKK